MLLKLLNLNTSEDQNSFPEMKVLNKIMTDLNVGVGLPEKALTYDQVNYFKKSSRQNSMVSMAACYQGGPGFKSRQKREFIHF